MKYLLLHGLGQTAASWDRVRDTLACGAEAVCPELPELLGDGPCRYDALYGAFSACCDGISGTVSLCGLSLGGILAMQYAAEHPAKVRSLVLIGTPYGIPKRLLKLQNAVFRLMPEGAFTGTGFQKREFISLCNSMLDLELQRDLGKIACPALVICGGRDRANRRAALELKARLPSAKLCIMEGAGHEVNVEAPEALGGVLNTFWRT